MSNLMQRLQSIRTNLRSGRDQLAAALDQIDQLDGATGAAQPTRTPKHAKSTAKPTYLEQKGRRFSSDYDFPVFSWAGREWGIRQKTGPIAWGGPQAENPNTGEGEWVKGASVNRSGELVLKNEGVYGGVEIVAVDSTGYGTYKFVYSGDFNAMDPHNVLGIFTYDFSEQTMWLEPDSAPPFTYKTAGGFTEIDFIEISRWGEIDRHLPHAGVTYYPDDLAESKPGEGITIGVCDIPAGHQVLTTVAEWHEDYLRVTTSTANGKVLSDAVATHRIPRDDAQQLHINLWTVGGNKTIINGKPAYQHAEGDTIVFHDFEFVPES